MKMVFYDKKGISLTNLLEKIPFMQCKVYKKYW
jgi:hypothetical protein